MGGPTSRQATAADAAALVDYIVMAGDGMPETIWAGLAGPGESARDVGLRRAARDKGGFSWRNATLFEEAGATVGCLIGYRLPDAPSPIPDDTPAAFVPLIELENLACGTWYINVLATTPEARGRGIGSHMLAHAREIAGREGCRGTSLIVFAGNLGARRLYRRSGYEERARRRVDLDGWAHSGGEAILMVREGGG